MDKRFETGLVWFRRDLRLEDAPALHAALQQCRQVHCVFVFDTDILEPLARTDRRVAFILASLIELDTRLRQLAAQPGAGLIVQQGRPSAVIPELARQLQVQCVFAAHDYEPLAIERDQRTQVTLAAYEIAMKTFKDHVIFEKREILTQSGTPYSVFTPYKNNWLRQVQTLNLRALDSRPLATALAERPLGLKQPLPTLQALGFESTNLKSLKIPTGSSGAHQLFKDFFERMDQYHLTRDFPAIEGPSYLGVHLRFGTISIRSLVAIALQRIAAGSQGAAIWLNELAWRDFYAQILANFPHVCASSFKAEYDAISWESGPRAHALFAAWCEGRTGYPLVDAAMAQLNQTGYMHNRLRMVSGSFLVKDLGIDWRWGERYFAQQLNDFELASNNGGWQWVSSSGCDAQPWFRIFNPVSQSQKFDPQGIFIRRYLPQLAKLPLAKLHAPWMASAEELKSAGLELGREYPAPLLAHELARVRTLQRYAVVKKPINPRSTPLRH
jgi:deoxyribodipyrimidine photo-lyase